MPGGWVTLQDVYRCTIDAELFAERIREAQDLVAEACPARVVISHDDMIGHPEALNDWVWIYTSGEDTVTCRLDPVLRDRLAELEIPFETEESEGGAGSELREQVEAIERWYLNDWMALDAKLRTSIVEGISVFLSLFDQPQVASMFCPPPPDPDESPRDEVVAVLRLHVCNTPYDFSSATAPADIFAEFSGYRWSVDSIWPPGIERTLRLSLPPNHPATGDPVIPGTVQVGEELTALTDGIMDEDVLDDVFTYQWVRVDADGTSNEEDITDATDVTYTLTADERGKKVKVEVRFVDILGGEETRTSAPTATLAGPSSHFYDAVFRGELLFCL